MTTSSSEYRQEWLGGRNGPNIRSIVQLMIQKEAFGGEQLGNTHLTQQRERKMDQGLCG